MRRLDAFNSLQMLITLALMIACNDLSVFVPKASVSNVEAISNLSLNEEGYLAVQWNTRTHKVKTNYEIFLSETAEGDLKSGLNLVSSEGSPLKQEAVRVPRNVSPEKTGKKVASTAVDSEVIRTLLKPGQHYLLQVIEKDSLPEAEVKAVHFEINFPKTDAAFAITDNGHITISWSEVIGANAYEIYGDEALTKLVGNSSETSLNLDLKGERPLAQYFIRAARGFLYSPQIIVVQLKNDSIKALSVATSLANGVYKEGSILSFIVKLPEKVSVFGVTRLPLVVDGAYVYASYQSGTGTDTLVYTYKVDGGVNSDLLTAGTLLEGELSNIAGVSLSVSLPQDNDAGNLKATHNLAIDTTNPTSPSSVGFNTAMSGDGNFTVSWLGSVDNHFAEHRLKFCATTTCDTSCSTVEVLTGTSKSYLNIADQTIYACVQGADLAGHASNWAPSFASLVIDKTNPTLPGAVSFPDVTSSSLSVPLSWTASVDTNLKQYNAKLCSAIDCSTGCGTILHTTTLSQNLTGTDGQSYHGCVQAEDLLGHVSNWVATTQPILIDTSIPTVVSVTASSVDGVYKEGDSLSLLVEFSEPIIVTGGAGIRLQLATGGSGRSAVYSSISGTSSLAFNYVVQVGDTAADLNYFNTSALTLAGGAIKDASGNNASLTLPLTTDPNALASRQNIVVDSTLPTAPAAVTFTSTLSNSTSLLVSWTASADTNFLQHNVKLCASNDCVSSCGSVQTITVATGTLTGTNGTSSFACVQGEDTAHHTSSWISSSVAALVDTSLPTVSSVTISEANGPYKASDALTVRVTFSEPVTVTNSSSLSLMLASGSTPHAATYSSGSGTATLVFAYTVQNGDSSQDLDYASLSALSLGSTGLIKDPAGNAADLTLPTLGGSASIAGQKAIILDTTVPTNPASVGFASTYSNTTALSLSWSNSFDNNFATHNAKICTSSDCATGCISATTALSSPASVTGVNGSSYYGCVQGQDTAGQLSAWISSISAISVDTSLPTVTSVSSNKANASYKAGALIDVIVNFSEAVYLTGGSNIKLHLASGGAGADASCVSGHGTTALTFEYTVQAGDTASDLDYALTTSLSVGADSIKDAAGNSATLTLPATGSASSLRGLKDLVLDTTAPAVPIISNPAQAAYVMTNVTSISGTSESGATIEVKSGSTVLGTTTASGTAWSLDLTSSPLSDGNYSLTSKATDAAGNVSTATAARTFTVDTITPLAPVITTVVSPTTDTTPSIAGTSEAGVTVNVYESTNLIATVVADGSGNWIVNSNVLTNGSYSLTAKATDAGGRVSSASAAVTLKIDTINPTNASAVSFASGTSNSTSVAVSWTNSTDANFYRHNVKICEQNDCSTSCTGVSTSTASPLTMVGVNTKVYYACVQGEDLVAHVSAWVPSASTVTINATGATVANVTSSITNGYYKAGDTIDITVDFSKTLTLTTPSDIKLLLETGTTDRQASYLSASGTSMTFRYTVQAGDSAADLDYQSTAALTLGAAGRIQDSPPVNDATLTLPPTGGAGSLAGNKAIVIDTTAPTNPTSVGFAGALSKTASFPVSWSASTDTNFDLHNIKLCAAANCSATCTTPITSVASPATATGADAQTYYACVQGKDRAGQLSAWVPSAATLTVDLTSPTVSLVSSTQTNGSYKAAVVIPITVQFSEPVYVTNGSDISLSLTTAVVGSKAIYSSGSGTSTLIFNYTIAAGENNSDLNYDTTSALTLGAGGLIRDAANNDATLTLPALGNASSLAGQKNLVIDTTAPVAPAITAPGSTYSTTTVTTISGTSESGAIVEVKNGATVLGTTTAIGTSWSLTLGSALSDGTYSLTATAQDSAGNIGVASSALALTVDTSAPAAPTVSALTSPTTNTTPTISGTAEVSITVKVYAGATLIGTVTSTNLGNWSLTSSALAEGTYAITAKATDPGNRDSAVSNSVTLKIDVTAPTNPSAVAMTSAWSNTANLGFTWTNGGDTNLRYHNVKLCTNSGCSAACVSGTTLTASPASLAAAEGIAYYACVQAEDYAGLTSSWIASASTAKVDLTAPAAPVISSPVSGSTSTTLISTVSGTSESGALISVYKNGTVLGTTTASGTNWSYTIASPLTNGTYSLTATATDAAGNTGVASSTTTATVAVPAPTANSGSDLSTASILTLVGSGTNAASQAWTKVSGPGTITFGSPSTMSTSVTASTSGTYVLRLTVTNASNVSVTDDMTLLWDNISPTFSGVFDLWQKSASEARITWTVASDNYTVSSAIVYDICVNATPGTCESTFTATYTVAASIWDYAITGLTGGEEIFVRATDALGNSTIGKGALFATMTNVSMIAGSVDSNCAIVGNPGIIKCWGYGTNGRLGNGTTGINYPVPQLVSGITNAIAVAGGYDHYCAILNGGTVKCWGAGGNGRLGVTSSDSSVPIAASGITNATQISASWAQSCVVLSDQTVRCWGYNFYAQLGNGTTTDSASPVTPAVSGVIKISMGETHSCAVLSNNTAKCWGQNNYGQLGDGTTTDSLVPVTVALTNIATISVGNRFTCAALLDGTARCWGNNPNGQLGNNSTVQSATPVTVSGLSTVTDLVTSYMHTCALLSDQTQKCWGASQGGALGDGTGSDRSTPVLTSGLTNIAKISRTIFNSCLVLTDGSARCSGSNSKGALGNGLGNLVPTPNRIPTLGSPIKIKGGQDHYCALYANGTVKCWGSNYQGQLGDGTTTDRSEPVSVSSLTNVVDIYPSFQHTCALISDGTLKCWGRNWDGDLGLGTWGGNHYTPETVPGLTGITGGTSWHATTCVILTDKTIRCWGNNGNGRLADGTGNARNTPYDPGLTGVEKVTISYNHACVVLTSGSMKCWGRGASGELGQDTDTTAHFTPVTVLNMSTAVDAVVHEYGTCALLSNQTAQCFGYGGQGRNGNWNGGDVRTPSNVTGLANVSKITGGAQHTCALLTDGTAKCWGPNTYGQLGDGTTNDSYMTIVKGLVGISSLNSGAYGTCAVLGDNTGRCWGYAGNSNYLGDGIPRGNQTLMNTPVLK